jgi:hypothetical protein
MNIIEFGNSDHHLAIQVISVDFTNDPNKLTNEQFAIGIYPILDAKGLKPGDEVSIDNIGDMESCIIFQTETSVDCLIKSLKYIKKLMNEQRNFIE